MAGSHTVHPFAPLPTDSATRALPESNLDATKLLTIREVSEILRVSRATAYKLCARGELRSIRVSNALRVREDDLSAYFRAQVGGGEP